MKSLADWWFERAVPGARPSDLMQVGCSTPLSSTGRYFPVLSGKFPVLGNIFSVNVRRELFEKWLHRAISCYKIGSQSTRIAKFPVEFLVSREFAWRRVRSYQFDWSHEVVLLNGVTVTVTVMVKAAHARLCHSRMLFVRCYPRETQEMVFDAHDRAFALFKGTCVRGNGDCANRRKNVWRLTCHSVG
jgi:hypothetical protein